MPGGALGAPPFFGAGRRAKEPCFVSRAGPQEGNPICTRTVPAGDTDTALMMQAAEGNLAAFEELVRRNQSGAWALAYRFLGDADEARDIVQEAFLKIYKAASRYQPTAKFKTYLYRVVARLCLDWRAKKRPEYTESLPSVRDPSRGPEALAADAEFRNAVQKCLAGLPPHQRIAITLRHYDGMTYEEIAEVLEVSPKAVDSLLQRARDSLRQCLTVYKYYK